MGELCKVNYPLYCCQCLNNGEFIIAGGGGAAKTGIRNFVEILHLQKQRKKCIAESIGQLDTTRHAVMSMSAISADAGSGVTDSSTVQCMLALSIGSKCCIYSILKTNPKTSQLTGGKTHPGGLTKRKKAHPTSSHEESDGVANYKFQLLHEIDSVHVKDGFQTSVKLSNDRKLVASGGSDGHVRAWKLPSKEKIFDSYGHKDDVTNIDISPDSTQIVTISRGGKAFIWDATTGHKTMELHSIWNMEMVTRNYHFRNCRFGLVRDHPEKLVLFTSHTPFKQDTKNQHCCVTKWAVMRDGEAGRLSPAIIQSTGQEPISSITVSADGTYLGIGFMEGSVAIYIAFSLQCAHRVNNLHSIFVTSLSFVHESDDVRSAVGNCDAALVSVSADCTCRITKLSSRSLLSLWLVLFLCVVALTAVGIYLHSVDVI